VRVPRANLLGMEGMGFIMLMKELAWERLMVGLMSQAAAEAVFAHTVQYTKDRKAFGKPIGAFQNTRFKLAEIRTQIDLGRAYADRCMAEQVQGTLSVEAAAAAKYWLSDMVNRIVDECVQLHGGYGFMMEYPVARAYIDNRAHRIYAGTNEIMKELISRTL
jgi:long-chain-acyl-CoA dehydrogenase